MPLLNVVLATLRASMMDAAACVSKLNAKEIKASIHCDFMCKLLALQPDDRSIVPSPPCCSPSRIATSMFSTHFQSASHRPAAATLESRAELPVACCWESENSPLFQTEPPLRCSML
jgi:hypothetical protein